MNEYNSAWANKIYTTFNSNIRDYLYENWWCPFCLSDKVVQIAHVKVFKDGKIKFGDGYEDFDYWMCECCGNDWDDYITVELDFKELYTKHKKINRKV